MSMDRRNGNGHRERDLGALIDIYLLRCAVEGKSPHTLKAYRETLGRSSPEGDGRPHGDEFPDWPRLKPFQEGARPFWELK